MAQRVASAVLWLLVVAQVAVARYLPQDLDGEASFVQDTRPDYTRSDCGDNWKHNFRCIPPSAENDNSYVIDNRPIDYTGSDCGPLGKHKYRCIPPMDASASSMDAIDTSGASSVQDTINYTGKDCGDGYKHNFTCIPPKKTSADPDNSPMDTRFSSHWVDTPAFVEDNRPIDYTGSDCGPLGKHKYRCVPPMDTSASSVDSTSGNAAFVEDNRPIDYTGSDCGPLGKHKYRCVPPMDTSAASFVEDTRPIDYSGSDCGPLGKHRYRCVPPLP